jgi:DNA-binding transcriptional ArsR family regulator
MRLIRETAQTTEPFAGEIVVHPSVCYDFVVSLRALMNPRTFKRSRRWAAEQQPRLPADVLAKTKFFFEGYDTSLGYGAARLISGLAPSAGPEALVEAVRALSGDELAMFMLDTGETPPERLAGYRDALEGRLDPGEAVKGLPAGWAARCRQILREPDAAQADLLQVFEAHQELIFSQCLAAVTGLVSEATRKAHELLQILPASAVIEHLAGGYTLSEELDLRRIVLAPSAFVYPYMSARVDERTGEALVIFGVQNSLFSEYEPVPVRDDLVAALKAMSDPNRLTILRLLADRPMYTSDLVAQLRLGQPTVHHHLAQLRTAGLLRQERDRHGMRYSIRREAAHGLVRSLGTWLLGDDHDVSAPTPDADGPDPRHPGDPR